MKGQITLVPLGGLCNRMRTICAATSLAKDVKSPLHVIWIKDNGLHANFYELFDAPNSFTVTNVDRYSTFINRIKTNLLCRSGRGIYCWLRNIYFDLTLEGVDTGALSNRNLVDQLRFKKVFITSWNTFYTSHSLSLRLFEPISSLAREISDFSNKFDKHTVGFHIRRTDNEKAILNSPTEQFIKLADLKVQDNQYFKFFLATDCLNTQQFFAERYKERVLIRKKEFGRFTTQGMQSALVDLYLLSQCSEIFGSYHSSFSDIAAEIGQIKKTIVRAD